jgi:hypothetical protein
MFGELPSEIYFLFQTVKLNQAKDIEKLIQQKPEISHPIVTFYLQIFSGFKRKGINTISFF